MSTENQTPRTYSRRAWLRGAAGVSLALPWLESLDPRGAQAALAGGAPTRLLYWFFPNGVLADIWAPKTPTLDPMSMPQLLQPFADAGVVGDINVLSGLDNFSGTPVQGGDHACGTCAMVTCAAAKKSTLSDLFLGISADQVAANAIGAITPRPSLELGMSPSGGNICDTGYPCPYSNSLSWNNATTPRDKRTSPHDAWMYLLGNAAGTLTPEQRDRMRLGDKSVLDYVLDRANKLNPRIGASDRIKLDQYLSGVRTMEKQLTAVTVSATCQKIADPGTTRDFPTLVTSMIDVMVFAFKCDLTRVITFMAANAGGPGSMPFAGVTSDFHQLTHMPDVAANRAMLISGMTWNALQFATLLKKLKAIPEGTSTVLGNSVMMYSSDVSNGQNHTHHDMPIVLAGSGGGVFKTGRHLTFTPEDPNARTLALKRTIEMRTQALAAPNTNRVANLHLSMLRAAGVGPDKAPSFGDSTGTLSQI